MSESCYELYAVKFKGLILKVFLTAMAAAEFSQEIEDSTVVVLAVREIRSEIN